MTQSIVESIREGVANHAQCRADAYKLKEEIDELLAEVTVGFMNLQAQSNRDSSQLGYAPRSYKHAQWETQHRETMVITFDVPLDSSGELKVKWYNAKDDKHYDAIAPSKETASRLITNAVILYLHYAPLMGYDPRSQR
jgi:hypothetical protein